MDFELKDRTCLVTGASAGIGAGIARLLAEQGAQVAATRGGSTGSSGTAT